MADTPQTEPDLDKLMARIREEVAEFVVTAVVVSTAPPATTRKNKLDRMLVVVLLISSVCMRGGALAWGQEVPYTLEDRDRLIRVEATLQELKDSVDRRFEQMDKRFTEFQGGMDKRFTEFQGSVDRRFEQIDQRFAQMLTFMWILASVFGGLVVATIGVTVWDRRTALAPALRRSRDLEEREERIERALRDLAQQDERVAEALRHVGLL